MKLEQVVDNHLCTGCGACAFIDSSRLTMNDSESHARRPDLSKLGCSSMSLQQASELCPGSQVARPDLDEQAPTIDSLQDQWGPVLEVWEGYAADPELRFRGSSGGVVTALALFCLEEEGMSGALHVKARKDAPLLNHAVLSRDRNSLLEGSGSRYAPASPCEELGQVEDADEPCVVIGKPCDVAATVKAAQMRPQLAKKLGLTVAIFCAGTPSLAGTRALALSLGADDPAYIEEIQYRGRGWPGEMAVKHRDPSTGSVSKNSISYADGWGKILQRYRQWRCHLCADHTGELADLSIGDPWYRPVKPNDPGRSLILVRTTRGRELLSRAMRAGYIQLSKRSPEVVDLSQPHLIRTQSAVWGRNLACRLMGLRVPSYPGKPLFRLWRKHLSFREKIQSVLGTIRRVWQRQLRQSERHDPIDPIQWRQSSDTSRATERVETVPQ